VLPYLRDQQNYRITCFLQLKSLFDVEEYVVSYLSLKHDLDGHGKLTKHLETYFISLVSKASIANHVKFPRALQQLELDLCCAAGISLIFCEEGLSHRSTRVDCVQVAKVERNAHRCVSNSTNQLARMAETFTNPASWLVDYGKSRSVQRRDGRYGTSSSCVPLSFTINSFNVWV
jgi:hypothetical protein